MSFQYLTVKDLSALLRVKEKTLYQWAELGQIPCIKMNGCLRFDPVDLQEWLASCKRQSYTTDIDRRPRKGGQD